MILFLKKLLSFRRKDEEQTEFPQETPPKSFSLYLYRVPEILTYFRRQKGIPKQKLELVLVDNEEQPCWKVGHMIELLLPDLNVLYLITERGDAYEELLEEAYAEYGLLIVLLPEMPEDQGTGNLVFDLNDWEKHLDIIL